jgi:hypothetical protein
MGSSGEPLGAVRLSGAHGVRFSNCSFVHLGSPYGLSVQGGSQTVDVAGCRFSDLSGGFLKLGSVSSIPGVAGAMTSDPTKWDSKFSITDNFASGQAVEYSGAAGFFGGYIDSADVSHNTVQDAGYSGFSLGWGWGRQYPPGFGNNTIAYNRISRVMTKAKDGGGIYVNGATNSSRGGSVMAHNWVSTDEHVFAVYYLDNGASHWHVTQNVATNSSVAWAYFMTGGPGAADLAAHNNLLDNLWYENEAAPRNDCRQYNCTVNNATVHHIVAPAPLPPAAVAIMKASGARLDQ